MSGAKGREEFALALALVKLDTNLDINLNGLYVGVPVFERESFLKKYNPQVLLELLRLKEEF
jgi:hypothetical protein